MEDKEQSQFPIRETSQQNDDCYYQSKRSSLVLHQDLNCLPYPITESELSDDQAMDHCSPGIIENKKKRAASEHIARIALSDLAKYFDLPITEASRNLKVGLTVLKKKCREFGIPRWPHRKIKSLDSLIHDLQLFIENHLQEEVERQQQENKVAAMVVAKRQRMLESEKDTIERKPFMELQCETKRFRQDVFKRRHRARAVRNQGPSISSNESTNKA